MDQSRDSRLGDNPRKVGVLGQEAVAWVDTVRPGLSAAAADLSVRSKLSALGAGPR